MKRRAPQIFAFFALAALLGLVASRNAAPAPREEAPGGEVPAPAAEPKSGQAPVVVELFTSQGCSSCPPADRLLSRLGREGLGGVPVLPLSFHVDYWNYIGWQDPFSQARWSRRQEEYARALESGRLYTPQAVIQGGEDCVGSRESCLERAVAGISRSGPRARIRGELRLEEAGTLVLRATVSFPEHLSPPLPEEEPGQPLEALAVVFETGLETPVRRGENARRTLKNDYVVRELEPIFRLPGHRPPEGETRSGEIRLPFDPSWRRDRLGVAVLLQETGSRRILAAWSQEVPV